MFFSVRKSVSIGGRTFIPCVCYEGGKIYEKAVQELADKELAVIWPERVFFQNGKVIDRSAPKKKAQTKPAVVRESVPVTEQAPEEAPEEAPKAKKKSSKKDS